MMDWKEAQKWEADWHSRIGTNTFNEERKQFVYAKKMGIEIYSTPETPYNVKNYGRILDLGGGETSLLLKVENPLACVVVDPCDYPYWITERYNYKGIKLVKQKGEDLDKSLGIFNNCWIYNCLQHVENPQLIIKNALEVCEELRIFEWIDLPICEGHIQVLTEKDLNKWLGGQGKVEFINEDGCNGKCYYGIFKGKNYKA